MSDCEHTVDWATSHRCTKCGLDICTDCGSRPVWWYAWSGHYCRQCAEKGGQSRHVELDAEKIRERLGGSADDAMAFIEACRS